MVEINLTEDKNMKYEVIINGKPETIDIQKTGSSISIERNGAKKTFTHHRTSSGFILEKDGKIFHTNVQNRVGEKTTINVNHQTISFDWKDPYQIQSGSSQSGDQGTIKAVMPGRVVKILVSKGQQVQPQQPVLVLEAMKMENEIKSAKGGVISSILVKEGDSVESGSTLIHIE